jgi:hypothetical protein
MQNTRPYAVLFIVLYSVMGLTLSLAQKLGIPIPDSVASAFLPLAIAATFCGYYFVRQRGVKPALAEKKEFARLGTILIALSSVIASFVMHGPAETMVSLLAIGAPASVGLLGLVFMVALLILVYWSLRGAFRFGAWIRSKNQPALMA